MYFTTEANVSWCTTWTPPPSPLQPPPGPAALPPSPAGQSAVVDEPWCCTVCSSGLNCVFYSAVGYTSGRGLGPVWRFEVVPTSLCVRVILDYIRSIVLNC